MTKRQFKRRERRKAMVRMSFLGVPCESPASSALKKMEK